MQPENTILLTDLDGTLYNSLGQVSPENRAAIDRYMAAGGRFAIATGREPRNARQFIGDLPQNAPAIVVNGCGVFDFGTMEYLRCWFLDRDTLLPFMRELLADFPALELQAYTDRTICYCTPEETANPQLLAMHRPCIFTTLDELRDASFFKCFLFAPEALEPSLMARLRAGEAAGIFRHVPGTTDVGGPITYHELLPRDVSKGSALRYIRTLPEAAGRTVIAAGDYWNDYELLAEADVSVAPDNAIDEIKALCTHRTVSNNDHVILHII
ncbi:MAG: HAD family phosphatase, partial [Oscillospiraceae bacterium]|nr:HAD family phosphatase [Oscillospiraceae bacterium]